MTIANDNKIFLLEFKFERAPDGLEKIRLGIRSIGVR